MSALIRPLVRSAVPLVGASLCVTVALALSAPLAAQAPAGRPANGAPRLRLSSDGRSYVVFGGQLRERVEGWRGFDFGVPDTTPHDDIFALTRVRLSADLHLGGNVRLFAEVKSALATNRRLVGGERTSDVDDPDLHQGYLELSGRPLRRGGATASRIGRQELALGRERLVSALDWSNVRRSFDGISVTRTRGPRTVTAFLVRPVLQQKNRFNRWDDHTAFFGAYSTFENPVRQGRMDVYWLGLTRDAATFNGTAGAERRQTVGVRLTGGAGRRGDYDVETAYQFGRLGGEPISAWMVASQFGRRFGTGTAAPRLYAGFDYASGDKAAGGSVQTFNQLFPLAHAYFGYIDLVGRQNIVDASGGLQWAVRAPFAVQVDGHRFWRASGGDALYRAGGTPVARPGTSASKDVGYELDVTLRYPANRHMLASAGYSRFFPGTWVKETGPSKPVEFAFFSLQYTM
jgi:hypothetical protein